MDKNELNVFYKQAIHLVRVGKYSESLAILTDIDRERPNVKAVLYPMAVCLEMLGRFDEALALCDRLITEFNEPKGAAIKARIQRTAQESGLPVVDLLSTLDSKDTPPPSESPVLGAAGPVPPVPPAETPQAASDGGESGAGKKGGLFSRLFGKKDQSKSPSAESSV